MPEQQKKQRKLPRPKVAFWQILKRAALPVGINVLGFLLLIFINLGLRIPLSELLVIEYGLFVLYAFVSGLLISFGQTFLHRRFPFHQKNLGQRLLAEYLMVVALTLLLFYLIYVRPVYPLVADMHAAEILQIRLRQMYIFVVVLHSLLFFLQTGYTAYVRLQKAQLDTARLKKEYLQEQFETLKNKVNPHFLFNSLNALSSLIHSDKDLAAHFVDELSRVYRYVLDHKDRDLVKLSQELSFIEAYIFLLQTRYRSSLSIRVKPMAVAGNVYLPPLTLQMLIENALRHNIISRDQPLHIEVSAEGESYLIVRNTLQPREVPEVSDWIGLRTIMEGYRLLTDQRVQQTANGDCFCVKVPLIRLGEEARQPDTRTMA